MTKLLIKLSIAAASLGLVACGSIFGPVEQRKVVSYELTDTTLFNSSICTETKPHNVLFISPMRANAPYDSSKMYYAERPFELNTFAYSQWVSNPTDMLTQVITKKILTSCLYTGIASSNALADAHFRLVTQLVSLRQDVTTSGSGLTATTSAVNKLVIYVQLLDLEKNKVISSRVFNEEESSEIGPRGMVVGENQLLSKFNAELIDWLKQNHD